MQMEDVDKAVATVTGLQVGAYCFRLTVRDQQGLSSMSTLTVTVKVKKGECSDPGGVSHRTPSWAASVQRC